MGMLGGLAITGMVCLALEQSLRVLAGQGVISSVFARQCTHALMGPVFISCWVLFDQQDGAYVAVIPLLVTLKFALVGCGLLNDEFTVRMLCRRGDRKEILLGPVQYGLIFVLATTFFFQTPLAVTALMNLCIGDVSAAIIGGAYGVMKWPWPAGNPKSIVGSLAFIAGSLPCSIAMIHFLAHFLPDLYPLPSIFLLTLTSIVAALTEGLLPSNIDNLTVFGATLLTYRLLQ
eukprot:m.193988 g.193988  ORF g.193988 m.193988 type:complete len:232 (+) comp16787_c2_seq2:177-872(+)